MDGMGMGMGRLLTLASLIPMLACSDQGPKTTAVSFTASGQPRTQAAGSTLSLVTRLLVDGVPKADVPVLWTVTGGEVTMVTVTNADGIARVDWKLPTVVSTVVATASVSYEGIHQSREFLVTTIAGDPFSIERLSSDTSSVSVNSCYRLFYVAVKVADRFGNAIRSPVVKWTVDGPIDAEGSVSSTEALFRARRSVGTGHARATIINSASVEVTFVVTEARYEINYWDDDRGGDPYFESAQNCAGYLAAPVDTVPAGQPVTWHNYRESPLPLVAAEGTAFPATPPIPPFGMHTVVFAIPGTYRYADPRYPGVIGTIIVQ